MKTYLLDTIERFKRFSQSLDVKTILCSKAWYVLNEDGDTENLIFQEDGTILVSVNGSTKKYTWTFIPQNQSLNIMHSETEGTMLKPAFMDGNILAFNKIGTMECMFLIDDSWNESQKMQSLVSVKTYLEGYEKKLIESEKKKIEEQEQKRLAELTQAEEERKRKEQRISELKLEIEETNNQLAKEQSIFNIKFSNPFGKFIQHVCKDNEDSSSYVDNIIALLTLAISIAIAICIDIPLVRYAAYSKYDWTTFDSIWISVIFIGICSFLLYFLIYGFLVNFIINISKYQPYWHYKELLKKYEKDNNANLTPFNFKQFKENIEPMIESYKNFISRINYLSNKIYNLTEELKQISNK